MPGRAGAGRDSAFVLDIVESCAAVAGYAQGKTLEDFKANAMLQDAIVRRLFIVGEAAKSLSEEFKLTAPSIDWRNMARLRDKLGHHYWSIEADKIWEIVVDHLPDLHAKLSAIVPGLR